MRMTLEGCRRLNRPALEVGGNTFTELVADSYLQFKKSVIDQTIVSSSLTKVLSTLREIPKNN